MRQIAAIVKSPTVNWQWFLRSYPRRRGHVIRKYHDHVRIYAH